MVFAYFNTCFLDIALEEWHSVTPHEDNQTVENFKFFLLEWFNAFWPNNTFLTQKEWMTNTTKNLYTLKVKDFGNISKTLNCFLTFMPHDHDNDTAFSDTDLKALLFKSMPLTWHNAYLLKGSHISDDFCQMQSYFVQFKRITDNQTSIKHSLLLRDQTRKSNINTFILTMDEVVISFFLSDWSKQYWPNSVEE